MSNAPDFWARHLGKYTLVNVPPLWQGYTLREVGILTVGWWPFRGSRCVYQFDLDQLHPMTLQCDDGTCIQPNQHAISDGLSISPFVEALVGFSHDRSLLTGYWHDSGFCDGGFFVRYPTETAFRFTAMSEHEVNQIIPIVGPQAPTLPLTAAEIASLFRGVEWFGWVAWNRHRAQDRKTGPVGHRNENRRAG